MSGWKMVAVVVAATGCAGAQRMPANDVASGHWIGEIDRNGWRQPVSFDLERDGGAWRGEWQSVKESPGQPVENLEVQGRDVRFETASLRVVGQVDGARLTGTVVDKVAKDRGPMDRFVDVTFGKVLV